MESEHALELRKRLQSEGFYCLKIHQAGFNERGIPDILCCMRSIFVAIEVKVLQGKQLRYTDHQKFHAKNIRESGGVAVGAVYRQNNTKHDCWAIDKEMTGKTDHLVWCSLAGLTEAVRLLALTISR